MDMWMEMGFAIMDEDGVALIHPSIIWGSFGLMMMIIEYKSDDHDHDVVI